MNVDSITGTAATGLLVFLGVVVAPQLSVWDAMTTSVVTLGAAVVTAAVAAVTTRVAPAAPARQFEYDAAWDHALADLTKHDVA